MNALLIGGLGPTELVLILVIVLIIFGAGKLPQIGDALGKGIRNFRKASSGKEDIDANATQTQPAEAAQKSQQHLPPAQAAPPTAPAAAPSRVTDDAEEV